MKDDVKAGTEDSMMDSKFSEIPYICEEWEKLVEASPEALFVTEESTGRSYSRQQMDQLSGRVYGWLRGQGVERETFVLIKLPRDARPFAAMLGVWKAGAAFVIVEDDHAPERVEAIRQDCECRRVIDESVWEDILRTEPLAGYTKAADHDLCFAVYTSGSTGRPKGVLHEYGKIRLIQASMDRYMGNLINNGTVMGMRVPLHFVVAVRLVLNAVHAGMHMIIMTKETARDPAKMNALFMKYQVTFTYMTPSILRVMQHALAPCLHTVMSGGEPASDLWVEGVKVINNYGMSESGFPIAQYVIDRRYETAPAGRPVFDGFRIRILDENDREVPAGEKGEVCFENPFFRGYNRMPEETEKAMRGGLFHSGDTGKILDDGNLLITGRINTMVKINGNRVEPGEIEAALKKFAGIKNAVVKGFEHKRHQNYLCGYYVSEHEVPEAKLRSHLSRLLPHYMIPSFFTRLERIPLNKNGKVDRFALPEPDVNRRTKTYAAPRTPEEETVCRAFEEILEVERVGIDDDFFELGGDSVTVAVLAGRLEDLQVEYRDVYIGRTPARICRQLQEKGILDLASLNRVALTRDQYPTPFQIFFYDAQLYDPRKTSESNFVGVKFRKDKIDAGKLKNALEMVFAHYAVFHSVLAFNHDGEVVWRYEPDRSVQVEIIAIEEYTDEITTQFIQPFHLNGELFCRCRIYTTKEQVILLLDMNHIITDGMMMVNFMKNLCLAYQGEELGEDYYYYYLEQANKRRVELESTSDVLLLRKMFDREDYLCNPRPDLSSRSTGYGEYNSQTVSVYRKFAQERERLHTNMNQLFVAATLVTLARFENYSKVSVCWYHNGRDEKWKEELMGMTLSSLPVAVDLEQFPTWDLLLKEIQRQGELGLRYSECSLGNSGVIPGRKSRIDVIYETGFDLEKALPEGVGQVFRAFDKRIGNYTRMQIVPFDRGNEDAPISYCIVYDAKLYSAGLIERFSALLIETLEAFADGENTIRR